MASVWCAAGSSSSTCGRRRSAKTAGAPRSRCRLAARCLSFTAALWGGSAFAGVFCGPGWHSRLGGSGARRRPPSQLQAVAFSDEALARERELLQDETADLADEVRELAAALKEWRQRQHARPAEGAASVAAAQGSGEEAEPERPQLEPLPPLPPVVPLPPPPSPQSGIWEELRQSAQETPAPGLAEMQAEEEPQVLEESESAAGDDAPAYAGDSGGGLRITLSDVLSFQNEGQVGGHRSPQEMEMLAAVQERVKNRRAAGELPIG
eukprot:TRINITY_DN60341_c0_g1_i1.p1 TRINITY_DN60341_c0_g1~~TRINITY_DN60341_c0_g1_i1.p1  ORF type:complete len:287 (-),score=64.03 TRINITY_DN60341_c0_g1_i1:13-810(-)